MRSRRGAPKPAFRFGDPNKREKPPLPRARRLAACVACVFVCAAIGGVPGAFGAGAKSGTEREALLDSVARNVLPSLGQKLSTDTLQLIGDVVATSVGVNRVDLAFEQGGVGRVEMLESNLVRVRFNPAGTFTTRTSIAVQPTYLSPPNATITQTATRLLLATSEMKVVVRKAPFGIGMFRPDDTPIVEDKTPCIFWDTVSGLVANQKTAIPGEAYFGLGQRGGPINRRGRIITLRNTDSSSYTEFTDPLYQSFPLYYGVRGGKAYGLFFDNPAVPWFDMDVPSEGRVLFGALEGELDYYVFGGPMPAQVANAYARLTGFTPLPPLWAVGYHHSRYGWTSATEILAIAERLRADKYPCDTLWLDIDYMDQLHILTWDPVDFPDPAGFNDTLDQMGFRRVNILEPCLLATDPIWEYMSQSGYLIEDTTGQTLVNGIWYGDVSWIDYSKDVARDWFREQVKAFVSTGISGLWNDLNEPAQNYMDEAVYDFNGEPRTDEEARNLYALLETESNYQALLEARPNERPWMISRAGYAGIQRYSANWGGDAITSFDSLRVNIQMSLSMGLSGQNFFGHDAGGFLGSPTAELYIRWLQFCCFTPLFRTHSMNNVPPREPWVWGEPYSAMVRDVIETRYRFLPYFYTLFENASRTGLPFLAPTVFYFEGDIETYDQDTDFMVGADLLIAPVYVEGATTRSVYLPFGVDWINYHTDQRTVGGRTITVDAPLDRIPLFVKAGAILVNGPVRQHVRDGVRPDRTAEVYPGPDSAFVMYEDDGVSFAYRGGDYLRTRLASRWTTAGPELTIERRGGDYEPPARLWRVCFHGVETRPGAVTLNGRTLTAVGRERELEARRPAWLYHPTSRVLVVCVDDSPEALSIETVPSSATGARRWRGYDR